MVKPLTQERRKAIRARRVISIQFRRVSPRKKGDETKWHLSSTQDMSVLGLSFYSEVPFHIDDILELQVVMSGVLDIFKGFGKVLRVEKKGKSELCSIAVKFVDSPVRRTSARPSARKKRVPASSRKKRTP